VAAPGTEREGTGVHRLFSRDEVIIATILHGLVVQGVTIGKLIALAREIRTSPSLTWSGMVGDALANREANFVIYDGKNMFFWSSKRSNGSLEDALTKNIRTDILSTICINLNVCFALLRMDAGFLKG
jgi:hypothetical protein